MDNVRIHFLTQRGHRTQMMSFLIETKNHHYILIDGGNHADAEYLHGYMQGLAGPKPVIDLWILTHSHSDHCDAFYDIFKKFREDFEIHELAFNFLPYSFMEEHESIYAPTIAEMDALLPEIRQAGINIWTPMAGDVKEIDGVVFRILRHPNIAFPMNATNNASLVIRMEACGQSVLFLGDLGVEGGDYVLDTVPHALLHTDFVQMAHHGQNGVEERFYQVCAPRACFWCAPLWLWNNDVGKGYNTHVYKTVIVREWMEKLGVKHHFVAKDGTQVVTLPYTF